MLVGFHMMWMKCLVTFGWLIDMYMTQTAIVTLGNSDTNICQNDFTTTGTTSGTIVSRRPGIIYPDYISCDWSITSSDSTTIIKMSFTQFALPPSPAYDAAIFANTIETAYQRVYGHNCVSPGTNCPQVKLSNGSIVNINALSYTAIGVGSITFVGYPTGKTYNGFILQWKLIVPCVPGTTGLAGECTNCVAGKYKTNTGSDACTGCSVGKYSTTVGASTSSTCLSCPVGSNSSSTSASVCSCNPGYEGPNGGSCTPCLAGWYKPDSGPGTGYSIIVNGEVVWIGCTMCLDGTYSSTVGATTSSTCLACPANSDSFYSSTVVTNCICNLGYTGSDGGPCTACLAGKYKNTDKMELINSPGGRNTFCKNCGVGTYSTVLAATASSVCLSCPVGTNSSSGTSSVNGCEVPGCSAGSTGPDVGSCSTCVAGKYKTTKGSDACTDCGEGTFSATVGASTSSVCLACPVNSNSAVSSSAIAACTCNAGFTGPNGGMCSMCVAGKYKTTSGSVACTDCGVGSYSVVVGATSTSTCVNCPTNSNSAVSSTAVASCTCNAGFTGPDGGVCSGCVAGKYKTTSGSVACTDCGVGSYSVSGGSSASVCTCNAGFTGPNGGVCSMCVAGKYKMTSGSGVCTNCGVGTYSETVGAWSWTTCLTCLDFSNSPVSSSSITSCICIPGFTGPDGGVCSACSFGKYKTISGSVACTDCGVGTYSGTVGSWKSSDCLTCPVGSNSPVSSSANTACTCNAGFTGPDGGVCSTCVAGKYKTSSGSVACTDCSAGTYSGTTGASACTPCGAGGVSQVGSTACVFDCPAGSTGPVGACTACVAGKYKTSAGSAACTDCGTATYSAAVGASTSSTCLTCPTNANAPSLSTTVTACTCNAGFTGPNGGSCSACLPGSFKTMTGSAACELCPNNTFSVDTGRSSSCVPCQANAVSVSGSASQDYCYCKIGYAHAVGMSTCRICDPGTYNSQLGRTACSNCSVGMYSVNYGAIGSETCVSCPVGQWSPEGSPNCNLCPANSRAAAGSGSRTNCICDAGYTGLAGSTCVPCAAGTYKAATGSALCSACPALTSTSGAAVSLSDCWCVTGYIRISGVCETMVPRAVAVAGVLEGVSVNSSLSQMENATQALRRSIALRLNISVDLVQIERISNSIDVRVSIFGRSETELNIIEGQLGLATTIPTVLRLPFTLSTPKNVSVLAASRAVVVGGSLLNLSTVVKRRLLQENSNIVANALMLLRLEVSRTYNVSLSFVRLNFDVLSKNNTLPLTVTIDARSEEELQTMRDVCRALQERGKLLLENSMVFLINGTTDAGPSGLNFTSALVRTDGVPMTLEEIQLGSTMSQMKIQLSLYYGVPESAVELNVVEVEGVYSVQTVVRAVQPATVESLQERFVQSPERLDVAQVTLALPFNMTNMDVSYVSVPVVSTASMPNAVSIESEMVYSDGTALSSNEVAQATDTLILQMSRFYGVDTSLVQVEIIPPRNPAVSNASSVRVVILSGVQTVDDVFQRAEQMTETATVRVVPMAISGLNNAQMTVLQGQMVAGRFVECPANYKVYNGTCKCAPGYMLQSDLSTCTACPAGKSSAGIASTTCTDCPENTFSTNASTACTSCHANSVSSTRSVSVDACSCNPGYFFFSRT